MDIQDNELKRCIIVLGKGRGGTSLTAGILYHLGVNMGDNMKRPNSRNKCGYFENRYTLNFNIKVLESNNIHINKLSLPPLNSLLPFKDGLRKKTKKLVKKIERRLWGFKDERNLWTFPLYEEFIENPYFIVHYRDAEAIAQSINFWENKSLEHGRDISKQYYELVGEFFKKYQYPRLNIHYEDFFIEPQKQIEKICEFIDVPFRKEAIEHIKPKMKHF